MIYELGHKVGSRRWKNGSSLISLPNHYEKSINLHLQKFIGKSQKPLLNQNNLSPCLTFSLLHCSHITYLAHQDAATNLVSWYIINSLCHACFNSEYFYLHIFRVNFLLKKHLSYGQRTSWTDNKPFSRLIGPTHINKQSNCPLKLVGEMLLSHSAIQWKHLNIILYVTATVFKPAIIQFENEHSTILPN